MERTSASSISGLDCKRVYGRTEREMSGAGEECWELSGRMFGADVGLNDGDKGSEGDKAGESGDIIEP